MSLIRRLGLTLVGLALLLPGRALAVCNQPCNAASIIASCCGGTSCLLDGTITVSTSMCTLDLGARIVTLSGTLSVGSNMLAVEAAGFRIIGSGLVNARGLPPSGGGGKVVMHLTGGASPSFSSSGVASSGIDASGFVSGGGLIEIHADGPVSLIGGGLNASSLDANGNGGTIQIDTTTGTMTVNVPVVANAGLSGSGGTVDLATNATSGDLVLGDLARLSATAGEGFGGEIDLTAGDAVSVAAGALVQANAVNGSASDGGEVDVEAGSVLVNGVIEAKGGGDPTGDVGGSGGSVSIEAHTGSLVLSRNTQGLTADGAGGGEGGDVSFSTDSPLNGALSVAAPVSAQGFGGLVDRPAGGGAVEATSAAGLTVSKSINVSGVGGASGVVDLGTSSGDLVVNNTIVGNDPVGGGALSLESSHNLVLADTGSGHNLKMNATSEGFGGEIALSADNDITSTGFLLDVSGAGLGGYGGEVIIEAGRHLTINQATTIDANSAAGSGAVGGRVTLTAGAPDRLGRLQTGNLQVDGDVTANGHAPPAAPNQAVVALNGCQVTISGTALIDSTGDPNSANVVTGRGSITVANNGKLRATASNTAVYRAGSPAPTTAGAVIQPSFTLVTKPVCTGPNTPTGCLVPCPTCGDNTVSFPETCDPPGCGTGCDIRCRTIAPAGCNDGNPCTADTCDAVFGCRNEALAEGAPCNDGNACTTGETCKLGVCTGDTNCDDSDPCTVDTCAAGGVCQHVTCPSDNNLCNGAETCGPNGCQHGALVVCPAGQVCNPQTGGCITKPCSTSAECSDGNPCTTDTCASGACSNTAVPNGTSCSDSNMCNGSETCQSGVCVNGPAPNCDDGNPCTDDTCSPTLGCPLPHPQIPGCCQTVGDCSGSNQCTQCVDHQCSIIANCCLADRDCDDGNACTTDTCNVGTHLCQHGNVSNGTPCGNVCNPASCQTGACVAGQPLPCPPDANVCTQDRCDPALGCVHDPIPGCCASDAECDDHDACTADGCDPDSHVCFNTPLFLDCSTCATDTDCDALGACGQNICDTTRGVCIAHTPPNCTDGRATTEDVCVVDGPGVAHCEHRCLPGACDDGKACNGVETCTADGSCVPGTPPTCEDDDACTRDGCDDATGCTHVPEVGYASIRCRLDTIALLLQKAGRAEISPAVSRKISGFLGKARVKLDAAERAGSGRPSLKALKAAGKQLKGLAQAAAAALKKKKIGTDLGAAIGTAAKGATDALATVKASTTP